MEQGANVPSQSPFVCPLCDAIFMLEEDKNNHLLNAHNMRIEEISPTKHAADPEKVCEFCEKVFAKPSMLIRHRRIHTGEKPFNCNVCFKAFNQKNALQIHMQKHSGDRPHICPFCQYAFSQKGNLRTHIQRNHEDQAKLLLDAQGQYSKEIID